MFSHQSPQLVPAAKLAKSLDSFWSGFSCLLQQQLKEVAYVQATLDHSIFENSNGILCGANS